MAAAPILISAARVIAGARIKQASTVMVSRLQFRFIIPFLKKIIPRIFSLFRMLRDNPLSSKKVLHG